MDGTHKYEDIYGGDEENGSFNISDEQSGSGAGVEVGVKVEESGRENGSVREEFKEEDHITVTLVLRVLGWYANFIAYNYYYKLFVVPRYKVDGANQILACVTALSLNVMSTALMMVLNWRKGGKILELLSPQALWPVVAIGVCYSIGIISTHYALSEASIATVHVVKSLEPLFIMLFCWLMMRDSPELDWHMFAAMNLVVLGSINFSVNDATWNLAAFSCAMLSNASSALMRVMGKLQMKDTGSIVLLLQMSATGILVTALCTCIAVYATPEPLRSSSVTGIISDVLPLLVCGVIYAVLYVWSWDVLDRVPVTTHAVLNVGKKFSLIVISTWKLTWDLALALAAQGMYLDIRYFAPCTVPRTLTWIVGLMTLFVVDVKSRTDSPLKLNSLLDKTAKFLYR